MVAVRGRRDAKFCSLSSRSSSAAARVPGLGHYSERAKTRNTGSYWSISYAIKYLCCGMSDGKLVSTVRVEDIGYVVKK